MSIERDDIQFEQKLKHCAKPQNSDLCWLFDTMPERDTGGPRHFYRHRIVSRQYSTEMMKASAHI
jgi:hypothetical protein